MKTKITPSASDIERRFTAGAVEIRAAESEGGPRKVRGYAAVFSRQSENMGGSRRQLFEVIEPGAFDDVLKDDVRALFNHDSNLILARSKAGAGTLALGADETGLWYEFTPPDTQAGRDLAVSLERGDVDQSSFAFTVEKDDQRWDETTEGDVTRVLRTIKKVSRLYDVSPVTYPAYPDATVALRAFDEHRESVLRNPNPPVEDKPQETLSPLPSLWAARLGIR